MRKICKVLAVIMAVMMLVTMATACKSSNEDEGLGALGSSSIGGNNNGGDNGDAGFNDDGTGNDDVGPGDIGGNDDSGNDDGGSGGGNNKPGSNGGNKKPGSNNDSGKKPDSFEDAKENYEASMKYDAQNNPLVTEVKKPNGKVAPSFDIDTTGFVKNNIKLKDLKNKKLTFMTAIAYDTFQYVDEKGKLQGEWEWFKALQKEYGLKINYIKSRFDKSMGQALAYMTAGKDLDVIPTHVGAFPTCLQLSQPLDPYVNMQNLGNSPGVDLQVLEDTKWGGTYRCIAPIGAVNVLWYNESLVKEMKLQDPHTLWQQGKWNWNTFRNFIQSVPATTPNGKKLCSYNTCDADIWYAFALTNGYNPVDIDTKAKEPKLINNFGKQECLDAWEFVCDTLAAANNVDMPGASWGSMYQQGNVMMHDTLNLMNEFAYDNNFKYCHDKQYNWVPYPTSGTKTGRDVAFCYGYTMMLPKKMKTTSNAIYAVKFMELWANRFTEAIFDYQATINYLDFDYAARREYFNFVVNNTYFGLQMDEWRQLSGDDKSAMAKWQSCFGSKTANVVSETKKVTNLVDKAITGALAYGL